MLKIHSEPSKPEITPDGPTLLALGFRPFFSAAGLAAVALVLVWLGAWSGGMDLSAYYGIIGWHSHEMLFGYAAAVIAGFLLTAVRNWTGVNTPSGRPLAWLALLWLAGRLLPLTSGYVPAPVIALLDLAFLPAVALGIAPPLWQGKQKVNRIFVPLLLAMALANLLVHLQSLGIADTAIQGADMMLLLVVFLVLLIAGRVVPFFTQAVIPGYKARRWAWVESVTVVSLIGLILAQLIYPMPLLTGPLALIVALTQVIRVMGWYDRKIWRTPILWVLYTGIAWMIVGFVMLALSTQGLVGPNLAKHALAVGGVGVLTLGMMSRVALGHTGRPLQPVRVVELSFVLLNLAALTRVFGPLIMPDRYNLWVHLSGGLWVICFLVFCFVYLPILLKPRVDGKPG